MGEMITMAMPSATGGVGPTAMSATNATLKTKLLQSLMGQQQRPQINSQRNHQDTSAVNPLMQKKALILQQKMTAASGASKKVGALPSPASAGATVVGRKCLEQAMAAQRVKLDVVYCASVGSFDARGSVAEEPRLNFSKRKSCLKQPAIGMKRAHFTKHVTFGTAGHDEQVTIHFYEPTFVDMPWNGPRPNRNGAKEQSGLILKQAAGYHGRTQDHALSYRML